jgi:hypothetical protein
VARQRVAAAFEGRLPCNLFGKRLWAQDASGHNGNFFRSRGSRDDADNTCFWKLTTTVHQPKRRLYTNHTTTKHKPHPSCQSGFHNSSVFSSTSSFFLLPTLPRRRYYTLVISRVLERRVSSGGVMEVAEPAWLTERRPRRGAAAPAAPCRTSPPRPSPRHPRRSDRRHRSTTCGSAGRPATGSPAPAAAARAAPAPRRASPACRAPPRWGSGCGGAAAWPMHVGLRRPASCRGPPERACRTLSAPHRRNDFLIVGLQVLEPGGLRLREVR